MQNKRLFGIVLGVGLLLLIPLIAMQFANEVNWGPLDFVVAGALLLITALLCERAIRKVSKIENRVVICLGILLVFFLVWVELAVGIFGTSFAGQ
ncbi:MAG: hypothetical protein SH819_04715 [Cytophagales bacterium]|nr:hypothetical protein [Cytophagales bacterium]